MNRQSRYMGWSTFLAVLLFLFVFSWAQPSEAQKSSIPWYKAFLGEAKLPSSPLNLTEVQKKSLEDLRYMYGKEAIPMRTILMVLKIELRHSLLNLNVQSQTLFELQRKISALQTKLEELSLSYQEKARSIFTREQLERLPQWWALWMGLASDAHNMGRFHRRY